MGTLFVPDSMNNTTKKFGRTEITLMKISEYVFFALLVLLSVSVYQFQGESGIFEYVVLSDLICFAISAISHKFLRSRSVLSNMVISEAIWVLWIMNGLLFNSVESFYSEQFQYFESCIVILMIIATFFHNIRTSDMSLLLIITMMLALFGFPHSNANFYSMSCEVAFIKAIIFIVCCVLLDVQGDFSDTTESCSFQIKIIRTLWILIVHKYFFFLSILVIVPLIFQILSQPNTNRITVLPVYNSDVTKEESTLVITENGIVRKKKNRNTEVKKPPVVEKNSSSDKDDKRKREKKEKKEKRVEDKPKESKKESTAPVVPLTFNRDTIAKYLSNVPTAKI
jgi:hypothetical protein